MVSAARWLAGENSVTFDLEPFIREATEKVAYEIEKDAEVKVAAVLRERGWLLLPPTPQGVHPNAHQTHQSNDVAGIVIDVTARLYPREFVTLDLRYGIADALWAAGYRKVADPEPINPRFRPNPPVGRVVDSIRPHRPMSEEEQQLAKMAAEQRMSGQMVADLGKAIPEAKP